MQFQTIILSTLISSALAGPLHGFYLDHLPRATQGQTPDYLKNHSWIPASSIQGSRRSPCPMLNTLANHGFLPRNGQGVTVEDFNDAQVTALNFDPTLAAAITSGMLGKLGAPQNESASFTLDQFDSHDHTEHDASLTRLDKIQGDFVTVNPQFVSNLLADASGDSLDTDSIGKSRARREKESIAAGSPVLTDAFTAAAQGEAALILLVIGRGGQGADRKAPKNQVQAWMDYERLPVEEGYVRSETVLDSATLTPLTQGIKTEHDLIRNGTVTGDQGEGGYNRVYWGNS